MCPYSHADTNSIIEFSSQEYKKYNKAKGLNQNKKSIIIIFHIWKYYNTSF